MNRNPVPFGAWILCPLTESISIPSFFGKIRYFPYAWIASTCTNVFGFFSLITLIASSIGSTAPISLLTIIIETRIVSSHTASRSSSSEMIPSASTFRYVTRKPSSSKYPVTAETDACSIDVVIIWFPALLFASAAPISAVLFDSVPPDVKRISFSSTFNVFAIFFLASLI